MQKSIVLLCFVVAATLAAPQEGYNYPKPQEYFGLPSDEPIAPVEVNSIDTEVAPVEPAPEIVQTAPFTPADEVAEIEYLPPAEEAAVDVAPVPEQPESYAAPIEPETFVDVVAEVEYVAPIEEPAPVLPGIAPEDPAPSPVQPEYVAPTKGYDYPRPAQSFSS